MVAPSASLPQSHLHIPARRIGNPDQKRRSNVNMGQLERVASIMLGSFLVANGIKRFNLLGFGVAGVGGVLIQRGASGYCPVYGALNVSTADEVGGKLLSHPLSQKIHVEKSVLVCKPPHEVYQFWRRLPNLPTFMEHLESVRQIDDTRSHWVARAPRGRTVEWNADIVDDVPNRRIAWKSIEGADVPNAGQVVFEPTNREDETLVTVVLTYDPPAGALGTLIAKLFGEEPSQTVDEDLLRFKQLLESGDLPVTEERHDQQIGED